MSDKYDWQRSYTRADQIIELVQFAMYADTEEDSMGNEVPVAYLGDVRGDLAELLDKWRSEDGLA